MDRLYNEARPHYTLTSLPPTRYRERFADFEAVQGPSFWTTQEIAEAPLLVESTCRGVAAFVGEPSRSVAIGA